VGGLLGLKKRDHQEARLLRGKGRCGMTRLSQCMVIKGNPIRRRSLLRGGEGEEGVDGRVVRGRMGEAGGRIAARKF